MNIQVFTHLLSWYLLILISGGIFWITFHQFFSKLTDRGYIISKILFLLITSLILWTLGFLLKLPIDSTVCIVSVILLSAGCFFLRYKFKIPFPKVSKKTILISELVFFGLLLSSLSITSIHPTIDNVTERIMDFKLLNVLTSTTSLPAIDVWYTPQTINYYYFGYFFFSIINKITFTDAFMGYLFSMSFIYAICGAVIFSIAISIKKNYAFGLLSAVFVLFFSNFSFIYNLIEKYFTEIAENKRIEFIVFSFDLILLLSIIFSLILIRRKNVRKFLLISIIAVIAHLLLTHGIDTYNAFKDFLLDPAKANLWFPDVSRVIDSTINEFPYYSIVIGDLHPHYLDLIFLPVMLALLYLDFREFTPRKVNTILNKNFLPLRKIKDNKERLKFLRNIFNNKYFLKILGIKLFSLAVFSAGIVTNSWEVICFGMFIFIKDIIFIVRSINFAERKGKTNYRRVILISLITIGFDAFVFLGAFISQLPYLKSVQVPVKGIKLNFINNHQDFFTYFKDHFDLLSFFKYFSTNGNGELKILFGLDRIIILGIIIFAIFIVTKYFLNKIISKKIFTLEIISIIALGILINSIVGVTIGYIQNNFDLSPLHEYFKVWFIFYLLSAIALFFLIKKSIQSKLNKSDYFILTSLLTGIGLSIFTEFFYVADYFDRAGYEHHRANTVFKVNYIGFVFFGIVSAWALYKIFNAIVWQKNHSNKSYNYIFSALISFLRTFAVVSVVLIFMYVPYSLNQWINYFPENIRFSLDGYTQTKVKYPDVIQATDFFKRIKTKDDVILESNGDGYKYHDIASVYTATPTVLGWWGHEAQWRETTDPTIIDNLLNERVADIAKVYSLTTGWQDVIKKYKITYVWVSDAEREKQNQNVTEVFENQTCFERVFQNTTVKIYKVDQICVNPVGISSPVK